MLRLERLQAILLQLQSRRVVRAQDIADKFGISLRTVYRDIRALEESGVPIAAEAGIGYTLAEGYSLPPVQFTKEEAAALLTGEKLLEKVGDVSVSREFEAAMNKIRAVLRNSEKDFLEILEKSIMIYAWRPRAVEEYPNNFISTIQEALVKQHCVQIEYFSLYNNTISQRKVSPVGITYVSGSWHLIAWCFLRKDMRDFRADRIRSLRLLDEWYDKDKLPSLQEFMKGITDPRELQKVVIRFHNSIVGHLHEQKFYYGLVAEKKLKDKTEMTFLHPSVESFGRWLIMWEDKSDVVSPPALKEMMQQLSKKVYDHYKK